MSYYSETDLAKIEESRQQNTAAEFRINLNLVERIYKNASSRTFGVQGLARRLQMMHRCIDNLFFLVPPDQSARASHEKLCDASINIQAFIFNTFGALDNLAWLWVLERGVTDYRGLALRPAQIGLSAKNSLVYASLSSDLRMYIDSLSDWMAYLEAFRHALAHRIPLYIPPAVLNEQEAEAYRKLDAEALAGMQAGNSDGMDTFLAAARNAGCFIPLITYSLADGSPARPIMAHAQLVADFSTVAETAEKVLNEI